MPKPTTFSEAVPAVVDLTGKQYDLVHGDANTLVQTDNGPVPSAAKAIADLNADYAAQDVVAKSATARDVALSAATAATAAAAAALTNGTVYATWALGMAATADGAQFDVVGDNVTTARIRYQRLSSTSSTEVTAYPAKAFVDGLKNYTDTIADMSGADDVFYARHTLAPDGSVIEGLDRTGQQWYNWLRITKALAATSANFDLQTLGAGQSMLLGDVEVTYVDTQYDVQYVDSQGRVFAGSIGGVMQGFGAGGGVAGADSVARKAARMYGKQAIVPGPIISYRSGQNQNTTVGVGETNRLRMVALETVSSIQIGYDNWRTQSGAAPNNPIHVSASIQYPVGGPKYPLYFANGGADRRVTILPNGEAVSKPLGIVIPKGQLFDVHTCVTADPDITTGATGSYPSGGISTRVVAGVDIMTQNTTTDYTLVEQPAAGVTYGYCYSPRFITGVLSGEVIKVIQGLIWGDSISQTAGAGNADFANGFEGGIVQGACKAGGIGYLSLGANGIAGQALSDTPDHRRHVLEMAQSCSVAGIIVGTNDLSNAAITYAQMETMYRTLWGDLRSCNLKVVQATIPPRTTSTDAWATTANQTPINASFGPEVSGGSIRQRVNTFIRGAVASGLIDAVVDLAAICEYLEPTTNTYVWKPNYSADGIHPGPTPTNLAATAFSATGYFNP